MTDPLAVVGTWPGEAAAGWATPTASGQVGPDGRAFPWASVTKILTSLAVWIAVEEGSVGWDDPAGPPGSTMTHLLAHASGLAPDTDEVLAQPGRRRIYSNRGIELVAAHVADRTGMAFGEYLGGGVIEPLGMTSTSLSGSAASGASGSLGDLMRLGRELLTPRLVSRQTADAVRRVAFAGLVGVLPGFGRQEPNDWGLGVEIRDGKHPHWTGTNNSPETFGHFGQSGAFLWVDPRRDLVVGSVSDRSFGPWAIQAWPALSDAVLASVLR